MNNNDLLFKLFQEYSIEARHHEQQRATVSGYFAALTAGVLTLVGFDKNVSMSDLPASLFLILIGIIGCVFCAKQAERFYKCIERSRQYRGALAEAIKDCQVLELKCIADKKAADRYPRLHQLKMSLFWEGFHILIAVFGILLSVMSVVGVHTTKSEAVTYQCLKLC